MQRGHYDVEQRHKTAIKQLQYRYKKNFGRCNNLTMRLWANSGSSPVRTAEIQQSLQISNLQALFIIQLFKMTRYIKNLAVLRQFGYLCHYIKYSK